MIWWILVSLTSAFGSLSIPTQLSSTDRKAALEILGYGTLSKVLSDPYPLGGYAGFEMNVTSSIIGTGEISKMGSRASSQQDTTIYSLGFGKGLFHNLDFYVEFNPPGQIEEVSGFGGQIRWGFYQADYLPLYASLVLHGNSSNFQNRLNSSTQGSLSINTQATDLVVGFNARDVTVFFGGGIVRAQGTFMGGNPGLTNTNDPNGITDPLNSSVVLKSTVQENISSIHYLAGVNVTFNKIFLAVQLDRVTQPTYGIRLGLRL